MNYRLVIIQPAEIDVEEIVNTKDSRPSFLLFSFLGYFRHRPRSRGRKFPPYLLKVIYDLLNDFPKLLVNLDRIVTVNPSDQIGALANVNLVLVAPLHPSMILVDWFHLSTSA